MSRLTRPSFFVSQQTGFSILETVIAAALVAVTALGLGAAMSHLSESRRKNLLVSQSVALESAIVTALQNPGNYGDPSSDPAKSMINGTVPTQAYTIKVVLDPGPPEKAFNISPGGSSVYFHSSNSELATCQVPTTACSDWTVKATVSAMKMINNSFTYAYQIAGNSDLVAISTSGYSGAAPQDSDYVIAVPPATFTPKDSTKCPDGSLSMTGFQNPTAGQTTGTPFCLYAPKQKCPPKTIAKGYQLVPYAGSPGSYSVELNCAPLRTLACPATVMSSGVPAGSYGTNAYALQNFNPNSLDPNTSNPGGSTSGVQGTCTFIGSSTSSTRVAGAASGGIGISSGACPAHYHVHQPASCTLTPDAKPADVPCPNGDPAVPVAPTIQLSYPSGGVLCQVVVTKVVCEADNSISVLWSGSVDLNYICDIDANVDQTTPAL